MTETDKATMIEFFAFKANQYARLNGLDFSSQDSADAWLKEQVSNQTEIVKEWGREFLAATS